MLVGTASRPANIMIFGNGLGAVRTAHLATTKVLVAAAPASSGGNTTTGQKKKEERQPCRPSRPPGWPYQDVNMSFALTIFSQSQTSRSTLGPQNKPSTPDRADGSFQEGGEARKSSP
jgi:hypothetical protein